MQPTQPTKGRRKLRAVKKPSFVVCAHCHVPDGATIQRGTYYDETDLRHTGRYAYKHLGLVQDATNGATLGNGNLHNPEEPITVKLILTYLDNNPANENDYNIRFLCQLCNARFSAVLRHYKVLLNKTPGYRTVKTQLNIKFPK